MFLPYLKFDLFDQEQRKLRYSVEDTCIMKFHLTETTLITLALTNSVNFFIYTYYGEYYVTCQKNRIYTFLGLVSKQVAYGMMFFFF